MARWNQLFEWLNTFVGTTTTTLFCLCTCSTPIKQVQDVSFETINDDWWRQFKLRNQIYTEIVIKYFRCFTWWECFLLGSEGWTVQEVMTAMTTTTMMKSSDDDKTPETQWWSLWCCWYCRAAEATAGRVLREKKSMREFLEWINFWGNCYKKNTHNHFHKSCYRHCFICVIKAWHTKTIKLSAP